MSLLSHLKNPMLVIILLNLFAAPFAGAEEAGADTSHEALTKWLERKVNVDYVACSPIGCVPVRSATLKEVTEQAIIVMVDGSPFLIPKYMIRKVELAE